MLQLNPSDPSSIPPALYDLLTRTPVGAIEDHSLETKPGYRVPVGESDFDESVGLGSDRAIAARLKEQMRADSLRPLKDPLEDEDKLAIRDALQSDDAPEKAAVDGQLDFDEETVNKAREYLQKNVGVFTPAAILTNFTRGQVHERLAMVLEHLRLKYFYCFWCGASYNDASDLETNCPGPDEDAH
jgi:hypothetical protein